MIPVNNITLAEAWLVTYIGPKPFADAARNFSFAIGPDGIDDGLTVGCVVAVGGLEREAILSTADFNHAAAILREGK